MDKKFEKAIEIIIDLCFAAYDDGCPAFHDIDWCHLDGTDDCTGDMVECWKDYINQEISKEMAQEMIKEKEVK